MLGIMNNTAITDAEAIEYAEGLREYIDDYFGDPDAGLPDDALSMAADLIEWVRDHAVTT